MSNLATEGKLAYAIGTDAALIGIDARTGKVVDHLEIAPYHTEEDTRSTAYLVAAGSDVIYVYYGDSRELIALSR